MVPVVPAPVSLFGASLGVSPNLNAMTGSAGSLSASSLTAGGNTVSSRASFDSVAGISGAAPVPFADVLTEAVGRVEELEEQAKTSIEWLISGKGVDVHEAMIAAQKAGMGFELVLSVRNKALAAYQQIMGMQF